jgi:hypothetical protein
MAMVVASGLAHPSSRLDHAEPLMGVDRERWFLTAVPAGTGKTAQIGGYRQATA